MLKCEWKKFFFSLRLMSKYYWSSATRHHHTKEQEGWCSNTNNPKLSYYSNHKTVKLTENCTNWNHQFWGRIHGDTDRGNPRLKQDWQRKIDQTIPILFWTVLIKFSTILQFGGSFFNTEVYVYVYLEQLDGSILGLIALQRRLYFNGTKNSVFDIWNRIWHTRENACSKKS